MRRLCLLVIWFSGCAQLIGLEERELDTTMDAGASDASVLDANMGPTSPDGGGVDDAGNALTCERYCTLARERCTAEQNVELFGAGETGTERCLGTCAGYPVDDPTNQRGNSLACRIAQLESIPPGDFEAFTSCPGAGPGGGAPIGEGPSAACGSNCESFCRLRQEICAPHPPADGPPEPTEAECLRRCQALPDLGTYNASADFMSDADNIQCRLAHLSAAGGYKLRGDFEQVTSHCGHSNIKSTAPCDLREKAQPNCPDYCKLVTTSCAEASVKVYDDAQQCVALCGHLELGDASQLLDNNVRCRRERAYDALLITANSSFCEAGGPAPPQCGRGKCANYCELAHSVCPAQFGLQFPGADEAASLAACEAKCAMIPDSQTSTNPDSPLFYSVSARTTGDTFNCRVYHTSLAAFNPAVGAPDPLRQCASAVGLTAAPDNVCK